MMLCMCTALVRQTDPAHAFVSMFGPYEILPDGTDTALTLWVLFHSHSQTGV